MQCQIDPEHCPAGRAVLPAWCPDASLHFFSKIVFRQGSFKDAEYWANEFGQREIVEETTSHTSGRESSDTTASAQKIVQTILPSQLAEIPDRFCYGRFPGMEGIYRLEFEIRRYKPIRPAFLSPGEPEPEFEDSKVEVVKKPEAPREEPFRIPFSPIAGVVALGLVGWLVISPPDFLVHPKKETTEPPYVPVPDQGPKYKVFHWTHGTFRCRIDLPGSGGTGASPWACVRVGPPRHPKSRPVNPPATEGAKSARPVQTSVHGGNKTATGEDPVVNLPVWKGPWPEPWNFACAWEWNRGKWLAVNRPVLFDGHLRDPRTGMSRFAADRVRIRCSK